MRIGIDFDNTIVNYDLLFQYLAKKYNLVDNNWKGRKKELRKLLVSKKNGVFLWKKLQGKAYGKYMNLAVTNKGIENFLNRTNYLNNQIFIISHKTKYGHYDKEKKLLRVEAIKWLQKNKFFDKKSIGIKRNNVYFEPTINKKIQRINNLNLDFFIDDLELILDHSKFNTETKKILFSLDQKNKIKKKYLTFNNWRDISYFIYGRESLEEIKNWSERILNKKIKEVKLISGQKNSTIYKIILKNKSNFVLKYYPDLIVDDRKRLITEFKAIKYLNLKKINNIPKVLKKNENLNLGYYTWLDGNTIENINYSSLRIVLNFVKKLKIISKKSKFDNKIYASEACLSIKEIIRQINKKLENLILIKYKNDNLQKIISNFLIPLNELITKKYDYLKNDKLFYKNINKSDMILNPSDFGFHNSLINNSNKFYFYDFEYFGWDDPVKLICDFYWHPGMNLSNKFKKYWLDESLKLFKDNNNFKERLKLSLPLYGFRWALIILNDFTSKGKKILKHQNTTQLSDLKKRQEKQISKSIKICKILLKNHIKFKI